MFNVCWVALGVSDTKVKNLEISGGSYYPVKIDGPNVVLESCKIHDGAFDIVKITAFNHGIKIINNERQQSKQSF